MTYLKDFLSLIYPEICPLCGKSLFKGEKTICIQCYRHLPRTRFYSHVDNQAARVFWGRVPLNFVHAAFFYNKGNSIQKLVHAFKYRGIKNIGHFLGTEIGNELRNIPAMNDLDLILPVPLHPRKQKKRGFNQSEIIARAIALQLNAPVDNAILLRRSFSSTQTKKSKYERWQNVERIFSVRNKEKLISMHVLLVDDVITTGATLESCAQLLLDIENVKISIAAAGFTRG